MSSVVSKDEQTDAVQRILNVSIRCFQILVNHDKHLCRYIRGTLAPWLLVTAALYPSALCREPFFVVAYRMAGIEPDGPQAVAITSREANSRKLSHASCQACAGNGRTTNTAKKTPVIIPE